MRKRSKTIPRTDAPSFGKFITRLVTGNPITEDISPIAKDKNTAQTTPSPAHKPTGPSKKPSKNKPPKASKS